MHFFRGFFYRIIWWIEFKRTVFIWNSRLTLLEKNSYTFDQINVFLVNKSKLLNSSVCFYETFSYFNYFDLIIFYLNHLITSSVSHLKKSYHSLTSLFAIHKTFGDCIRREDLISERKTDITVLSLIKYNMHLNEISETHLCLNSWKTIRLGNPCLQIRIPSRTPLHLSWSRTRWGSSLPA